MRPNLSRRDFLAGSAALCVGVRTAEAVPLAEPKRLVLLAGAPSHGPGAHEFNAGAMLLAKCLAGFPGLETTVIKNGWPKEGATAFEGADAILCYADGNAGHPFVQGNNLAIIGALMQKGVGLMCAHFGVEVPKNKGADEFRAWIGGCYEHEWSCNPMWTPEFNEFPNHPITRGVKPFAVTDEWYFNMRFRPQMQGITSILSAVPSEKVRDGPYVYPKGPYPHIVAAKGRAETMMWAVEREDGGRGVGFTGGHFHKNWANDNFRKIVLNALVWICKLDVPADGVASTVTDADMTANLDPKGKKK